MKSEKKVKALSKLGYGVLQIDDLLKAFQPKTEQVWPNLCATTLSWHLEKHGFGQFNRDADRERIQDLLDAMVQDGYLYKQYDSYALNRREDRR